ncbi:hypothetical protein BCV70DRAFT_82163 [Testicularia cyperi]|uniref:Uncharacterized protein n=1 Tax=Testicularia cyperi TaxID=1882483 RepID=A0A317XGW7_9BASI|nr:hypothetical protein BCV70DRAFT_82163 [Testicularia cyperi]
MLAPGSKQSLNRPRARSCSVPSLASLPLFICAVWPWAGDLLVAHLQLEPPRVAAVSSVSARASRLSYCFGPSLCGTVIQHLPCPPVISRRLPPSLSSFGCFHSLGSTFVPCSCCAAQSSH